MMLHSCEVGLVNMVHKHHKNHSYPASPQAFAYVKKYTESIFQENKSLKNFKFQVLVKAYGHDHLNSSVLIGNLFNDGQTYAVITYTLDDKHLHTEIKKKTFGEWQFVTSNITQYHHEVPINQVVYFKDLTKDRIKELCVMKSKTLHPPVIEFENLSLVNGQLRNL